MQLNDFHSGKSLEVFNLTHTHVLSIKFQDNTHTSRFDNGHKNSSGMMYKTSMVPCSCENLIKVVYSSLPFFIAHTKPRAVKSVSGYNNLNSPTLTSPLAVAVFLDSVHSVLTGVE